MINVIASSVTTAGMIWIMQAFSDVPMAIVVPVSVIWNCFCARYIGRVSFDEL